MRPRRLAGSIWHGGDGPRGSAARVAVGRRRGRVGAWSHARRRFIEAESTAPEIARAVVAVLRRLFTLEQQAKEFSLEDRLQLRQQQSAPLLAELRQKLLGWKEQLLPKHPMAEAVNYTLGQWTELSVFCSDGAVPIDNNQSEREMKRVVLNRKNSLFVGNPRGGRTAAILASLTSTCRRHDVDPQLYLTQLLVNLPTWPVRDLDVLAARPVETPPRSSPRQPAVTYARLEPVLYAALTEIRVSRTAKLRKVLGHPPHRAKTPFRAGLYARVSTQDQQTIPMQTRALREYATRRGWTIALQVKEIGSGASQRERREQLLEAARRREIDVVLVWRLDRWGRSVTDLLATLQELEHLGVGFVSLTEALDLTTPAGRAMAGLLAVFAEFEREILRERVRAGLAHARQNGQRLGRPLTAGLHADEVRKLYRAGFSKSEIARRLKTGRTSVRRILTAKEQ